MNEALNGDIEQAGPVVIAEPMPNIPHTFNFAVCVFLGRRSFNSLVMRNGNGLRLALRLRMIQPISNGGGPPLRTAVSRM